MSKVVFLSICCLVLGGLAEDADEITGPRPFPENFLFGAATASYQVEGGWDEDGRTPSIWDTLTHRDPSPIDDGSSGDIAADSYHNYERDVEMMRELGLDFYRFSLSWNRIMPTGFANEINKAGIDYYNNLIDEMLKYNIKPMVTLYHWDLPQKLQDLGGFANPLFVEWFSDYARVAYEFFGSKVKNWITFNEPKQICLEGYGDVSKAPMLNFTGIGEYLCAKNLLLAHAKAWHVYNDEYRAIQGGINGITINCNWYEAASASDDNIHAAVDALMFDWGQYVHPIFSKNGDFPDELKTNVAVKSLQQGYHRSRLPTFTQEEIDYVRGSSDYLGINTYSTKMVYRNSSVEGKYAVPSYFDDLNVVTYPDPAWPQAASSWLQVVPWGFYKMLSLVRDNYNNPPIFITENGFSSRGGLDDTDRVNYYKSYLSALLDAVDEGSDIRGYTAWSLMDNFEWMRGYTERFGLYEVDFSSSNRTRTARKSALVYKQIVRTRSLDVDYEPLDLHISIDEGH